MEITITHLTRMRGDLICVAGLTDTGQHVRPVPREGRLTRAHVAPLFHLGAVVRLGRAAARDGGPMPEDHWIDLDRTELVRDADRDEVADLLDAVAVDSLCEAFTDLQFTNRSAAFVEPMSQVRTLVVVRADRVRSIFPDSAAFTRLRFSYKDPSLPRVNLPVTDLRCYPESDGDWDIDAVIAVLSTVPDNRPAFACIGLSKSFQPGNGKPFAQWLQMNALLPVHRLEGNP